MGDKCAILETLNRAFLDIYEELLVLQNFFFVQNYPPPKKKFCKARSSSNISKNALLSASGWNPKLHNYHPPLMQNKIIDIFSVYLVVFAGDVFVYSP